MHILVAFFLSCIFQYRAYKMMAGEGIRWGGGDVRVARVARGEHERGKGKGKEMFMTKTYIAE